MLIELIILWRENKRNLKNVKLITDKQKKIKDIF